MNSARIAGAAAALAIAVALAQYTGAQLVILDAAGGQVDPAVRLAGSRPWGRSPNGGTTPLC